MNWWYWQTVRQRDGEGWGGWGQGRGRASREPLWLNTSRLAKYLLYSQRKHCSKRRQKHSQDEALLCSPQLPYFLPFLQTFVNIFNILSCICVCFVCLLYLKAAVFYTVHTEIIKLQEVLNVLKSFTLCISACFVAVFFLFSTLLRISVRFSIRHVTAEEKKTSGAWNGNQQRFFW